MLSNGKQIKHRSQINTSSKYRPILDAGEPEIRGMLPPAQLNTPLDSICLRSENLTTLPCAHELWVNLNTADEDLSSYTKFTLRISWPAFVRSYSISSFDISPSKFPRFSIQQILDCRSSIPKISTRCFQTLFPPRPPKLHASNMPVSSLSTLGSSPQKPERRNPVLRLCRLS